MGPPTYAPTAQPTAYPTSFPTSQPTPIQIYISENFVFYGTFLFAVCLCIAICCCRKGSEYKRKIYLMMDEAKIDVDANEVKREVEEWSDDDESTVQLSKTGV